MGLLIAPCTYYSDVYIQFHLERAKWNRIMAKTTRQRLGHCGCLFQVYRITVLARTDMKVNPIISFEQNIEDNTVSASLETWLNILHLQDNINCSITLEYVCVISTSKQTTSDKKNASNKYKNTLWITLLYLRKKQSNWYYEPEIKEIHLMAYVLMLASWRQEHVGHCSSHSSVT